jgi:hypothetical protein
MSDLLLMVPAALALCVIVYWIGFLPSKKEPSEPKPQVPSDAELKKMTKAQIEQVARGLGVELDKRKTKVNMIADLKSQS